MHQITGTYIYSIDIIWYAFFQINVFQKLFLLLCCDCVANAARNVLTNLQNMLTNLQDIIWKANFKQIFLFLIFLFIFKKYVHIDEAFCVFGRSLPLLQNKTVYFVKEIFTFFEESFLICSTSVLIAHTENVSE